MLHTEIKPAAPSEDWQSYSFKHGPMTAEQTVHVSASGVGIEKDGKPTRTLAYEELEQVRFWMITTNRVLRTGLALEDHDDTKLLIEFMDNGMRPDDHHRLAYRLAVATIMEHLSTQRPDLEVKMATSMGAKMVSFISGLIVGIMGLLMAIFLLPEGATEPGLTGLFAFIGGAIMAFRFRPWKAPKKLHPLDLAEYVVAG